MPIECAAFTQSLWASKPVVPAATTSSKVKEVILPLLSDTMRSVWPSASKRTASAAKTTANVRSKDVGLPER